MDGGQSFQELHRFLQAAREDGVSDQQLAYSVMAAGAGQPVEPEVANHEDFVWRLAWQAFVRAPALDLPWLITTHLMLDRIYRGEMSTASLIDRLAMLEEEFAAQVPDPAAALGELVDETEYGQLCAAALRGNEIHSSSGDDLRQRARSSIVRVRRLARDGGLLDILD